MTQVKRTPLAEQAAEVLMDRIRSGEWDLGSKLPGETTLAPQLGVGRSTVREAIRQLAGRGVLATKQGAGVFVIALEVSEDWETVLRRSDIVAVIEARIAIESEAAALAAERRTPTDLATIRTALEQRGRHAGGANELVDLDTAFHRAIVAAAHSPILLELFDSFIPRLQLAMVDLLSIQQDHATDEDQEVHTNLMRAISDRDGIGALAQSRTHLQSLRDAMQQNGDIRKF